MLIPKGCNQQNPDCEELDTATDKAASTNKLCEKRWRGSLQFQRDRNLFGYFFRL